MIRIGNEAVPHLVRASDKANETVIGPGCCFFARHDEAQFEAGSFEGDRDRQRDDLAHVAIGGVLCWSPARLQGSFRASSSSTGLSPPTASSGSVTIAVAQALQQPGPIDPDLNPIAMHVDPLQGGEQKAALRDSIGRARARSVPLRRLQQSLCPTASRVRVRMDRGVEIGRRDRKDFGRRGQELNQPIEHETLDACSIEVSVVFLHQADVRAIGAETLQGLRFSTPWFWDKDEASRQWGHRMMAITGHAPGWIAAGTYSAVMNYLNAVKKAGTDDAAAVLDVMDNAPIADFFVQNGTLYPNGRLIHDMYLVEVKKPGDIAEPEDYLKLVATVPASEAFRPYSQSDCKLR